MTAAPTPVLAVTLTELVRRAAARMSGARYRSAVTGAWCEPLAPHVPGCTCPPGGAGCDTCWASYLHAVAGSPVPTTRGNP